MLRLHCVTKAKAGTLKADCSQHQKPTYKDHTLVCCLVHHTTEGRPHLTSQFSIIAHCRLPCLPACPFRLFKLCSMTTSTVFHLLHDNCAQTSHSVRRSSTMERRESILGSLKHRFSRGSAKDASASAPSRTRSFKSVMSGSQRQTNDNPYAQSAPPTRRPGAHLHTPSAEHDS